MCHENKMGAAKEQHPYIICRLDKQKWWNSGTVTRPLFTKSPSKKTDLKTEVAVIVYLPLLQSNVA